jgi:MFS family permease
MATRSEIGAVYAGAVVQGIVLVAFPAVSSIFTSRAHYGLSDTEYGGMFVPQAITAILAALLGAGLTRKIGGKKVLLIGLAADLVSMALLFGSQFATGAHELAFGLLVAATGCLGLGFGFVVPSLNTFTAAFFPDKVDRSILTLNALLGVGTALAPIFATLFVGLGFWWGLPLLMGVLTLLLVLFTLRLPLADSRSAAADAGHAPVSASVAMPARFWLYAAFALIYGVCETMNGNWAPVYMAHGLAASDTLSSLALTVFWVTVTGGRVLFAALEHWFAERHVFRALPALLALAFVAIACVPKSEPVLGIFAFGLAGLGCSALLPLVISFGQGELTSMRAGVAGALIGFYQMGYGIAAFGVGPLQSSAGLNLNGIYRASAAVAVVLTVIALLVVGRKKE